MKKQDLALNNQLLLMYHKTTSNQSYVYKYDFVINIKLGIFELIQLCGSGYTIDFYSDEILFNLKMDDFIKYLITLCQCQTKQ